MNSNKKEYSKLKKMVKETRKTTKHSMVKREWYAVDNRVLDAFPFSFIFLISDHGQPGTMNTIV